MESMHKDKTIDNKRKRTSYRDQEYPFFMCKLCNIRLQNKRHLEEHNLKKHGNDKQRKRKATGSVAESVAETADLNPNQ